MSNGSTNTNTDGSGNVAFDFTLKGGSDCINDATMAEITRRLQGFLEQFEGSVGGVVFSVDPPNDVRNLWIEISSTGAIIGTVKRYDSQNAVWTDDHFACEDLEECGEGGAVLPQVYAKWFKWEGETTTNNDQLIEIEHNLGTNDYTYTVVFTDVPKNDTRWWEDQRNENSLDLWFRDGTIKDSGGQPLPHVVYIFELLTAPE